ncbi:MAG: M48 family metalloprotease [Candidatus Adiutrix sp.]|jgi:Zn-dependent protease with chaperone function|nr:M48 family metalloprotease [Candidatus Adiutrix sp.]
MDFWAREDEAGARSRSFYLAFSASLVLAVIVFYFMMAVCYMAADLSLKWFIIPLYTGRQLWDIQVASLPAFIYGTPQRLLALRPILMVGSFIMAIILGNSLYKTRAIKKGGGAYIAAAMGGQLLQTPQSPKEKQLVNVVEEMAVASGLPCPRIFIMPKELSINAVTAGLDHEDAIVAVTKGALNHLERDEIQGVVAHEFAHILNGDYALNLTMAGWLYGLLFFSVQGRDMINTGFEIMDIGDDEPNLGALLVGLPMFLMGLVLWVGGWLGKLTAEIIQAAFSREREHLADAFAVQFTRNPAGLAGALKKIAAAPGQGAMINGQALIMKSFFIVSPAKLRELWRSHPRLSERILTLEPEWDGALPEVDYSALAPAEQARRLRGTENLSRAVILPKARSRLLERAGPLADHWTGTLVLGLLANGQPTGPCLDTARRLYAQIPGDLRAATSNPALAPALVAAVFIGDEPGLKARQLALIEEILGSGTADRARELKEQLSENQRLPLLGLTSPALQTVAADDRRRLGQAVKALVRADGKIDIFEVAACQILKKQLGLTLVSAKALAETSPAYLETLQGDVVTVLSILAYRGADSPGEAQAAFAVGRAHFNQWPPFDLAPPEVATSKDLALALDRLSSAPEKIKTALILGAVETALHNHRISPKEYEVLRALAAALEAPLPLRF